MSWDITPVTHEDKFGIFSVVVSAPGKETIDVSFFRNVPAQVTNMTYADPFSDSTATIEFPQVTPYDDLNASNLWWLNPWTNYDIYWVPATKTQLSSKDVKCINPLTNKKDLWLNFNSREVMWEGFSVSIDPSDKGASIQLQGALFQLDRYIAFPFFPPRPVANEFLLEKLFSRATKPLRFKPLQKRFPTNWTKTFTFPKPTTDYLNQEAYYAYLPWGLPEGSLWTGLATRNTGSNDSRILTGFTQELLGYMYTDDNCGPGIAAGDQWTIRKDPGRTPVLYVRSSTRTPDFELWYGLPGVDMRFTYDGLTATNVIYGEGTNESNNPWSNIVVSTNGDYTTKLPLAYDPAVYPYKDKLGSSAFPSEGHYNMGSGVTQAMGTGVAKHILRKDGSPSWLGDITLKIDPNSTLSKWKIRPGMTVKVKGFAGLVDGINFHIAEVNMSPQSGTVTMKVDSKYRDLLSIEQVRASVRDTMTPAKMLQINRRQFQIEDMVRPWDYSAGSGFIPTQSVYFHKRKDQEEVYPWRNMLRRFQPSKGKNSTFYVATNGHFNETRRRWSKACPIITSQAFTVRRVEFVMVDKYGELITTHPYHVSIYTRYLGTPSSGGLLSMPRTGDDYSPFTENHFHELSPSGQPWGQIGGDQYAPDPSMLWGVGRDDSQGGYWPNQSNSPGALPTGMLVDETQWSYDQSDQKDFQKSFNPQRRFEKMTNTRIWLYFYTDYPDWAYLIGRIYRKEPGQ